VGNLHQIFSDRERLEYITQGCTRATITCGGVQVLATQSTDAHLGPIGTAAGEGAGPGSADRDHRAGHKECDEGRGRNHGRRPRRHWAFELNFGGGTDPQAIGRALLRTPRPSPTQRPTKSGGRFGSPPGLMRSALLSAKKRPAGSLHHRKAEKSASTRRGNRLAAGSSGLRTAK